MSSLKWELMKATKVTRDKKDTDQSFYEKLYLAVDNLPDEDYEALSKAGQSWAAAAGKAYNAKKPIADLPKDDDDSTENVAKRGAAPKAKAPAKETKKAAPKDEDEEAEEPEPKKAAKPAAKAKEAPAPKKAAAKNPAKAPVKAKEPVKAKATPAPKEKAKAAPSKPAVAAKGKPKAKPEPEPKKAAKPAAKAKEAPAPKKAAGVSSAEVKLLSRVPQREISRSALGGRKGNGVNDRIKTIMIENPQVDAATLYETLQSEGIDCSIGTVRGIASEFRHSLRVLLAHKKVSKSILEGASA